MAVKTLELQDYLNKYLNIKEFSDYCPNGLQVEGSQHIEKCAFAVSATLDSISKAKQWGAQALIVHHGIFWKFQGARPLIGPHGERARLLIQNNMNLFGYHLPLDAHLEVGNAFALAKKLNLSKIETFGVHKKTPLGAKGQFSSPISAKDLQQKLNSLLNHNIIHAGPQSNDQIRSIGIITGGANNEWVQAYEEGLDAYLTGEISEYNWHDAAEANLHMFAGGHHATEKFGIQFLMDHLSNKFSLESTFFDSENPA